jgi:chromosomal replication initiator protein
LIDGVLQLELPGSDGPATASRMLSSFVVGPENELAVAPLQRLLGDVELEAASRLFNPLVLVGGSGSGKSQLVQGIVRHWRTRLEPAQVEYFTAADFCREAQAATDEDRLPAWRAAIRSLRLLAIDDLQRLRPRPAFQQELRQAIDEITAAGGVVIATAEREPTTIGHLDSGLRDRLAAGLAVRLQRPSLAARRAILQLAASARGTILTDAELARLASREAASPAELIGRVTQHQVKTPGSLPLEGRVGEGDGTRVPATPPSPNPCPQGGGGRDSTSDNRGEDFAKLKQIIAVTARFYGLTQAAITGPARRTSLVEARNVAVYLARRLTSLSYADIGRGLGGRDHTTIMHADRRLAERLAHDPVTQQAVDELDRLLR